MIAHFKNLEISNISSVEGLKRARSKIESNFENWEAPDHAKIHLLTEILSDDIQRTLGLKEGLPAKEDAAAYKKLLEHVFQKAGEVEAPTSLDLIGKLIELSMSGTTPEAIAKFHKDVQALWIRLGKLLIGTETLHEQAIKMTDAIARMSILRALSFDACFITKRDWANNMSMPVENFFSAVQQGLSHAADKAKSQKKPEKIPEKAASETGLAGFDGTSRRKKFRQRGKRTTHRSIDKNAEHCEHCKKQGHSANQCWSRKKEGENSQNKCKLLNKISKFLLELLLIEHAGRRYLVDSGCSRTIIFVPKEDELSLQNRKARMVSVSTLNGRRHHFRVKGTHEILGTTLNSLDFSTNEKIILTDGRPIDVIIGMDFINRLGGIEYRLDRNGNKVLNFPKAKFTVKNSILMSKSEVRKIPSAWKGCEELDHYCLAAVEEPEEDLEEGPVRPEVVGRLTAEDLWLMRLGYAEKDIKAIPAGSKILKTISLKEAEIYKIQLPFTHGVINRRYVVKMLWRDRSPPKRSRAPAAFGLEKLSSESFELATEEWEAMVKSKFMLPVRRKMLKMNIPLLAVEQLHKTTKVRLVAVAGQLSNSLISAPLGDSELYTPACGPDFIRHLRGSAIGKRRAKSADVRKAFLKMWVLDEQSYYQGFRVPMENGATYRCSRLMWGTTIAPKILAVVLQDILEGDKDDDLDSEDLRENVSAYFDDLYIDGDKVQKVTERLARYDFETKPPETVLDSNVLGLRVTGETFARREAVPQMIPHPETGKYTYKSLATWLGRLVAHSPIGGSLRVQSALLHRIAGLGPNAKLLKEEVPEKIKSLADRLYSEVVKSDPVKGIWQFDPAKEWVLYTDASSIATGAVLTIGGQTVEDGSWLRKKNCNLHINIAELDGVIDGLKIVSRLKKALIIEGRIPLKIMVDNVAVASWLLKLDPEMVKCNSRTMVIHRLQKFSKLVDQLRLDVTVQWIASAENLADAQTRVPEFLKVAHDESKGLPKKVRRINPADQGLSETDPEGMKIVELLRSAGQLGMTLGSLPSDLSEALKLLIEKKKNSVTGAFSGNDVVVDLAAAATDDLPRRGSDDKVIVDTAEELLDIIRLLHAKDHPGEGEMHQRIRLLVSRDSPALKNHGFRTLIRSSDAKCASCLLAKPHVFVQKMLAGKRKKEDSGNAKSDSHEPNRLIYRVGRFPFEQVHIDVMGPWFKDINFLVLIDSFSKFVMIEGLIGTPTHSEVISLLERVEEFCTYPRRVIVDQGRYFIHNKLEAEVNIRGSTLHHTGTAAHWQNGTVERVIGDFGNRLTARLNDLKTQIGEERSKDPSEVRRAMQDIVRSHNTFGRADSPSPASFLFKFQPWLSWNLNRYRPVEDPEQYDLDLVERPEDRQELSDGPKVGEFWKVKSTHCNKNGDLRHTVVQVKSVLPHGMVQVRDIRKAGHQKRLVQHQLLERISDSVASEMSKTKIQSTLSSNFENEPPDTQDEPNSTAADAAGRAEMETEGTELWPRPSPAQVTVPPAEASVRFELDSKDSDPKVAEGQTRRGLTPSESSLPERRYPTRSTRGLPAPYLSRDYISTKYKRARH